MARLLDILINSYGRMSVLNTVELHLSGPWLTRLASPSVNLLRILKTNVLCNYRLLYRVRYSVMASGTLNQEWLKGLDTNTYRKL